MANRVIYAGPNRYANEKKSNKIRQAKSGWVIAWVVMGCLFVVDILSGACTTQAELQEYAVLGAAFFLLALILKIRNKKRAKRVNLYESMIDPDGNTSIVELAEAARCRQEKTISDLEMMIKNGFYTEGYIDFHNKMLVMTRNGKPLVPVEESVEKHMQNARKSARMAGKLPDSIDDLITMTDDRDIKNKLFELNDLTAKIDKRVEEKPELVKQVKDFREKYYPEVVRLTDAYNQKFDELEDIDGASEDRQGSVTVNLDGAPELVARRSALTTQVAKIKAQLVSLIDSVVEASENLLERLYEDDLIDISSDIKALQTKLASNGLLDSDFDI